MISAALYIAEGKHSTTRAAELMTLRPMEEALVTVNRQITDGLLGPEDGDSALGVLAFQLELIVHGRVLSVADPIIECVTPEEPVSDSELLDSDWWFERIH